MERFIKRPAPGQDEEDLLDFQSQFLSSGQKPSATLVKCAKKGNDLTEKDVVKIETDQTQDISPPKSKKSKFRRERDKIGPHSQSGDVMEEMDHLDTHITTVLSNIIKERDVSNKTISFPASRSTSFPLAPKSKDLKKFDKKKKESLFAQQFIPTTSKENSDDTKEVKTCSLKTLEEGISKLRLKDLYPESRIVTGTGLSTTAASSYSKDVSQINEDNIAKLSQMTEQEILQQQDKLKSSLDPKLLQFLMKKNSNKKKSSEERFLSDLKTNLEEEKAIELDLIKEQEISKAPPKEVEELKNKWMHMDVVEEDKLKWMQESSTSDKKQTIKETKNKKIEIAQRFDFEGNLISSEKSHKIPSHVGLHHHGTEPDLPGYTLQELVDLSRSEFMQQRVLSLKILTKIVLKDKQGQYKSRLSNCLLSVLLDAGLPFIIRWSLDEKSQACLQASVQLLWAVVSLRNQEKEFLDVNFLCYRGCEFPSLQTLCSKSGQAGKIETDFELTSQDLILGFLKMDLLPRIRYILEVCKPELNLKLKCLEILERICSHSLHACMKIVECPRLMEFIVEQYLPITWTLAEQDSNKLPFPQVLRMIRIICQSGKNIAKKLLEKHKNILTNIMRFVHVVGGISFQQEHGFDEDLNGNANPLVIKAELEAWKLWIVCLSYGITADIFRNCSSNLVQQLQKCTMIIHQPFNHAKFLWVQHVLKCFSTAFTNISSLNDEADIKFPYFEIEGYVGMISVLLQDVVTILTTKHNNFKGNKYVGILSAGLDILFICSQKLINLNANELTCALVKDSTFSLLKPLTTIVLKLHKNEQKSLNISKTSEILNLPSLELCFHKIEDKSQFFASMKNGQFINSYLRCAYLLCRADKTLCSNFVQFLISWGESSHHDFFPILNNFTTHTFVHTDYWASKLFILVAVQMASTSLNLNDSTKLRIVSSHFHNISLSAFSNLRSGDEHYAHDLLSAVLFHPNLTSDSESNQQGESSSCLDLQKIRATYMTSLTIPQKLILQSKQWSIQNSSEITTFFIPPSFEGNLVPLDWFFIPIMQVYDIAVNQGGIEKADSISISIQTVTSCLSFLKFLLEYRSESLKKINITAILVRLLCVFMTGSDVFLESSIHSLLTEIFGYICSNLNMDDLDFNSPIPGILSFTDFYSSLLEHFEGDSYGNDLFAAVILIPLTQRGSSKLKLLLWLQRAETLKIIRLKSNRILLPSKFYHDPQECDNDVIMAYIRALARGYCTLNNSPFLYKLAIHHIALYLFKPFVANETSRKNVFKLVKQINDEVVRQHIFSYNGLENVESGLNNVGLELNKTLLESYQQNCN